MTNETIENGIRQTLARSTLPPGDRNPAALCAFCESLLRLEWPGRRVAVTPMPEDDIITGLTEGIDLRGVLDVTIGPLPDDPVWATFRVVVADEVARREWIVAATVLLETARSEMGRWRGRTR